jgi:hypothetical protein
MVNASNSLPIPSRYLIAPENLTHAANIIRNNVSVVPPIVQKGFFDNMVFGVHIGVLFLLFGTIIVISGIVLFFLRERIRGTYYRLRWPERVIKVFIHYPPSKFYKVFWRLIPRKGEFDINQIYRYDENRVIKEEEYLGEEREGDYFIKVKGREYKIDIRQIIGKRGGWPEIHYNFNVPEPLDYSNYQVKEGFMLSGSKIKDLVKSDLWEKALNLAGQNALIAVCIILGVINLFISIVIASKVMGLWK